MAQLFNILKITVGRESLCARVLVNPGMPLRTSENIEATARVYYLAPAIAKHLCLGDTGSEFQECMGDTELAHLLEHVTVEIMNETGLAGKVSCGRTRAVLGDERLFDIELSCPDDALTVGSLSSATFMMDWAFLHPESPAPDFAGTVAALRKLVLNLRGEDEPEAEVAAATQDGAVADGAAEEFEPAEEGPIETETAIAAQDEDDPASRRRFADRFRIRPKMGAAPAKRVADIEPVFGGAAADTQGADGAPTA